MESARKTFEEFCDDILENDLYTEHFMLTAEPLENGVRIDAIGAEDILSIETTVKLTDAGIEISVSFDVPEGMEDSQELSKMAQQAAYNMCHDCDSFDQGACKFYPGKLLSFREGEIVLTLVSDAEDVLTLKQEVETLVMDSDVFRSHFLSHCNAMKPTEELVDSLAEAFEIDSTEHIPDELDYDILAGETWVCRKVVEPVGIVHRLTSSFSDNDVTLNYAVDVSGWEDVAGMSDAEIKEECVTLANMMCNCDDPGCPGQMIKNVEVKDKVLRFRKTIERTGMPLLWRRICSFQENIHMFLSKLRSPAVPQNLPSDLLASLPPQLQQLLSTGNVEVVMVTPEGVTKLGHDNNDNS